MKTETTHSPRKQPRALVASLAMVLGLLVFLAVVAWKRYISLGSMVTAALFPVLAWLVQQLGWAAPAGPWLEISSAAIAAVVLIRHRHNWRRLRRGLEPRLGDRAAGPSGLGAR
jgi:glycerol-3-phosphate acyltransferase PlsY